MDAPNVFRPRDLREAIGVAFLRRGRVRWQAGTSRLLGLTYDAPGGSADDAVIDVRAVAEFRDVQSDRFGVRIGAFADVDRIAREPLIRAAFGDAPFGPEAARFRLAALGAGLVVASTGKTRTTSLEELAACALPENEIPLAVTLPAALPNVAFGDRRIRRRDGAATFELRVFVALGLTGVHRMGNVTVAYTLDGEVPIPLVNVGAALAGSMIAKSTFARAAREAANAFTGNDEKTSVVRRTIVPLVLSALNDAYDVSRAATGRGAR